MVRLPIPSERIAPRIELTRAERHYLVQVLRLPPGATLEVIDGVGARYSAALAPDRASLSLGSRVSESASEAIPTYLAQALAKGERMDLVVQKSTELGARAVAPFTCERSVVRLEPSRAAQRVERWRRIAAAAAAQCGRSDLPAIWPISSLEQVLERASQDGMRALMLWEQERATRLSEAVSEQPGPLMLVVGPEGGFSEEEVARARALGARTVSLGRRVLRTETAALAALAVVQFLRGDLG